MAHLSLLFCWSPAMLNAAVTTSRSTTFTSHVRSVGARTVAPLLRGDFDEFGDRIQVTIGGNIVTPRAANFPDSLDAQVATAKATITPFADFGSVVFAPLQQNDAIAACVLGIALLLGPDFALAPAGLVSDRGIRPGYALEAVVGGLIDGDAQWLKDRNEGLQADAPLIVRAPILFLFIALGLLVDRLLLVALEDVGFVISTGICACLGGGLLEVIRPPLPTRAERDLQLRLGDEFVAFSTERLAVGGTCHEREIIGAFRKYYPR